MSTIMDTPDGWRVEAVERDLGGRSTCGYKITHCGYLVRPPAGHDFASAADVQRLLGDSFALLQEVR